MPSAFTLRMLDHIGPLGAMSRRLARRRFPPLAAAPKVQGRAREWLRLAGRLSGYGEDRLFHDANDWLMRTMRRECRRPAVTAVHAYEDCSLWSFEEARRLGKACIYDMPIGYYRLWEQTQSELAKKYADWLPDRHLPSNCHFRPEQKRKEMELADLVLIPSRFVEGTIRAFHPNKHVAFAPYGIDLEFWRPPVKKRESEKLRFIYAGQISVRKGMPSLIEAWEKAALRDAELELVGSWYLADHRRMSLPLGIVHRPPCAPAVLREHYHQSDVLVFPSLFEGLPLALHEGMACGLSVIASNVSVDPETVIPQCGRVIPAGSQEALVEGLQWFDAHRDEIPVMSKAARAQVERFTWERYRRLVTQAVLPYV
jgi:glycosyltransferase involved in cell wall biosynthesis